MTNSEAEIYEAGQKLIDQGYEYWKVCQKNGVSGAVIWIEDTDGKLMIISRGDYRHQLMNNIHSLGQDPIFFTPKPEDSE